MLADLLSAHCGSRWRDWLDEPAPDRLDIAFLPSRAQSTKRAVALVFHRQHLRAVLKLAAGDYSGLHREEAVLRHFSNLRGLGPFVPHVLGAGGATIGGVGSGTSQAPSVWALPVAPVEGRLWRPPDAGKAISPRGFSKVERVLRGLDETITRFARTDPYPTLPTLGVSWIEGAERLGLDARRRQQLRELQFETSGAVDSGLWAHGDLAPGNVRLAGSRVHAILDWEMFDAGYEPWFDRLYPALLALSSVLVRRQPVSSRSWPLRWLRALEGETPDALVQLRCLRVTAELASRTVRLERGTAPRWALLASYLDDKGL